ncbi:MAG: phosphoglucosamine mutase [Clostridiales bacterium]|jgi:phosphoglucosamine mutase|nr:phosphoglucosamine mutase [Clostridiales bacterium]
MFFGTDGIRGKALYFFDDNLAYRVGRALVGRRAGRKKVVIARDTRLSGEKIEAEVIRGLSEYDSEVYDLGIMPTMAVSNILKQINADYGVMISASHNPPEYNGIKIFDRTGQKLSLEEEKDIENALISPCGVQKNIANERVAPKEGRIIEYTKAREMYSSFLLKRCAVKLDGCKIKLDCCFGACAKIAPAIFAEAGAEVIKLADEYDGSLINVETGSTNIDFLKANMNGGDYIGFAFDGDGDRMLAATPDGFIIDGDRVLYILTLYFKKLGILKNNAVVGTLMTNYGFEKALNEIGVELIRVDVGDKYVIERMNKGGYVLGGETSGHIIINENGDGETGDGILAALMLTKALRELRINMNEVPTLYFAYPQKTVNIKASDNEKARLLCVTELKTAEELCREKIKGRGRVLIRPSGTEDKIRITAEGDSEEIVDEVLKIMETAYSDALKEINRK